jgi:hypothetical protein
MTQLCLVLFMIVLLSGCAQHQKLYSWEDYSTTLYRMKKNPCNETQQAHMAELKKIIDSSKETSMRVPPGVYCEYGYLLMIQGRKDDAMQYFVLEKQTYPESATFITNLTAYLSKAEHKDQNQTQAAPEKTSHLEGGVGK